MRREKGVHFRASMPPGAIYVHPDCVAAERASQVPQRVHKPMMVALGSAEQAPAPQQRRHPAEEVEALAMHTLGGYSEALAALRPPAAQPGVQCEARLIFEDNGLVRGQCGTSFFRLSWNCCASSARAWTYVYPARLSRYPR